ncbi:MAG: CDP-alcohol phosphatidyltransferase family protein [Opitutales bacterium]
MRQLPNIITLSRVVVLGLIAWTAFADWRGAATLTFFLLLYGAISDFVDGYLARRYGLVTNFGKIMDALVDKIMVLGSLVVVILLDLLFPPFFDVILPAWLGPTVLATVLVALIAVREIGITLLRLVAARKGVVLAAEKSGKRKAIWQITAICVLLAQPMFALDVSAWTGLELQLWSDYVWINGLLYFLLAAYLTIVSGAAYINRYWKVVLAPAPTAG